MTGKPFAFERTINLGHVLTIVALLGGGIMAWSGMQSNIQSLDGRVAQLEEAAAQTQALTTRVAVVENTIATVGATLARIYTETQETNGRLTQLQVDIGQITARLGSPP